MQWTQFLEIKRTLIKWGGGYYLYLEYSLQWLQQNFSPTLVEEITKWHTLQLTDNFDLYNIDGNE